MHAVFNGRYKMHLNLYRIIVGRRSERLFLIEITGNHILAQQTF